MEIKRISSLPVTHLGEGPHWDQDSQSLLYVDVWKSELHRYYPCDGRHRVLTVEPTASGNSLTFAVPVAGHSDLFLISMGRDIGLVRWGDADPPKHSTKLTILASVDQDKPKNILNDCKCDFSGRLWAGSKGDESSPGVMEKGEGKVYLFDQDMKAKVVVDKIDLSNGLTWSIDQKTFYYIDTGSFSVDAFDLDDTKREVSNRRKLVDYKAIGLTKDCPDGMNIDTDGNLWVANFSGSKIICIDPKASKIIRTIDMPVTNPTCISFGGPDRSTMFVTSARYGLSEDHLKTSPDEGGVFQITGLGVTGAPQFKAKLDKTLIDKVK